MFLLSFFQFVPSSALAGANQWTSIGPDGGFIRALAIDPFNPATLYVGTQNSGVFKSTDGGGSWSPANTGLTTTSVDALAIDPLTPATLYAGTQNSGVFKSTDGGGSWSPFNTGLTNMSVSALAIDPSNPATLYAGTCGGEVFKSTDGGGSWSPANTGLTTTSVDALAIDPLTPTTLYAGTSYYVVGCPYVAITPPPGVFKSTDGGRVWSPANTGLTGLTGLNVYTLTIDPFNPATLYIGIGWHGVFKSTDSGGSWSPANTGLTTGTDTYAWALAIDPSNPATLYVGEQIGATVRHDMVFKSTDGGESWSPTGLPTGLTITLGKPYVTALVLDLSNPATLYAGTYGGGVFKYTSTAAPEATTGTATAITPASVTLHGTVNPNGLTTTAQFEYGLTTAYGTTARVTLSPNKGSTAQNVSAAISGLQTGKTYHYRLTATNSQGTGVGNDVQFQLYKANQTILFGAAPSLQVGGTGRVSATGGASGNPVMFSSTTPAVCATSGANGSTVTGKSAGICTLAADQAGNASYHAAPQVKQTFRVGKGSQIITFGAAPAVMVGGTGKVSATGGASGNPVTFSSTTPAVCTTRRANGRIVTGKSAGTCTLAADQAGNASYHAAPQAKQSFSVTLKGHWKEYVEPPT